MQENNLLLDVNNKEINLKKWFDYVISRNCNGSIIENKEEVINFHKKKRLETFLLNIDKSDTRTLERKQNCFYHYFQMDPDFNLFIEEHIL